MKRIHLSNVSVTCAKCGEPIFDFSGSRKWRSNDGKEPIIGVCFMSEAGDPVEAFDLCDDCIGKLYSKLIY